MSDKYIYSTISAELRKNCEMAASFFAEIVA